jgi:hypothetical protein
MNLDAWDQGYWCGVILTTVTLTLWRLFEIRFLDRR